MVPHVAMFGDGFCNIALVSGIQLYSLEALLLLASSGIIYEINRINDKSKEYQQK